MNDHPTCNDIAIGRDGSGYVTDSAAPQILRLPPGATQLEVWTRDLFFAPPVGSGISFDGIAFGTNGNLHVDTCTAGELFRIDMSDGKAGMGANLTNDKWLRAYMNHPGYPE